MYTLWEVPNPFTLISGTNSVKIVGSKQTPVWGGPESKRWRGVKMENESILPYCNTQYQPMRFTEQVQRVLQSTLPASPQNLLASRIRICTPAWQNYTVKTKHLFSGVLTCCGCQNKTGSAYILYIFIYIGVATSKESCRWDPLNKITKHKSILK